MLKTKTKKRLKRVRHFVTKRKLVRKKTSRRVWHSVFIFGSTLCVGSLAFAITTTQPIIQIGLHTNPAGKTLAATSSGQSGGPDQVGQGSWYAIGLPAPDALTCASTRFPRGTYLQVTNKRNGRSVTCLVNDYGPEAWTGRVIDLSRGSFRLIDSLSAGTAPVEIRVVTPSPSAFHFNLPLRTSIGAFMGYSLCQLYYDGHYCNDHRQLSKL